MLKASELRKGNIVFNEKLDIFKTGYIILEARDIYNFAVLESGQSVDEKYLYFKPIKITEDFISKKYPDFVIEINDMTFLFLIISLNDGFCYPTLIQEPETSSCETQSISLNRIEFVHELQNLCFALAQKELEF